MSEDDEFMWDLCPVCEGRGFDLIGEKCGWCDGGGFTAEYSAVDDYEESDNA